MKKHVKIISVLIALMLLAVLFSGCGGGIKPWESKPVSDDTDPLYRDYYHIFVYSFADSNGDGIGDLKGVEEKLSYISDLGFTGIWLSPINPSPSYHKYDVIDYYDVDDEYGTLQDYDSLVASAHKLGIGVMLDFVINHSSNLNPWFTAAKKAYIAGETNEYSDYYKFHGSGNSVSYDTFGGYSHMPKLNLDSDNVRSEIENVMKFWLKDHNTDAFRLDAAYHFYSEPTANVTFMQWLMKAAKKYNPDCYMVGEVWMNGAMVNAHYAENSVQSFFNFDYSSADGYNKLFPVLNQAAADKASQLTDLIVQRETATSKGIDALFASNHDISRISNAGLNYYSNREEKVTDALYAKHKMGIALLYTMSGNVYNYYGNEIGLRNGIDSIDYDSYKDQTYRIAMNWGNNSVSTHKNGAAYKAYGRTTRFGEYDDLLGGVAEQLNDQNSLYNFYRRVMLLRRQNPTIARGRSAAVDYDDSDVAILTREYNGKKLLLVYNLSSAETKNISLGNIISWNNLNGKLEGFLSSNNNSDVKYGKQLTMPPYSVAVIS